MRQRRSWSATSGHPQIRIATSSIGPFLTATHLIFLSKPVQTDAEPSHLTETRWPRWLAYWNVHKRSAATSPSITLCPPPRSGLLIPRVRRRAGARRGANSSAKRPSASADRRARGAQKSAKHPRCDHSLETNRRPDPRPSASTTFATKPSPKLQKPARPMPTLMAVAGHMSRRMPEHYGHVRMAEKRSALEKLESG